MALPVSFLARLTVPLIAAILALRGQVPEHTTLFKEVLESSDKVLSQAKGEGEGPTEYYDYIIVGAGSAGAVLANRLTADGSTTVLLLEAGGDPNPVTDIPMAMYNAEDAGMMLPYTSVNMTKACVVKLGGTCPFPRGKALGGSSSVNGLVYNRCNSKDYDSWANFTGDPIWRFDSVVDAFRAIESYHGFYEDTAGPNHGTTGELYISKMEYTPGDDIFLEAVQEQGIPIGDLNSGTFPYGFGKIDYNMKDGLRHSAYHAFLEPILNRTNLKIYRYAWVTKVHLDSQTKQAQGVTYERHGQQRYVGANQEVILAAGVIDTPKILMLSGIGPSEHLSQFGIPTILDLPVGNYLQEHLGVVGPEFTLNKTLGLVDPFTPENIEEYVTNATGPLYMLPWWNRYVSHIAMGYIPSKTMNDPTWPDIHVYINEELYAEEGKEPEETIFPEVELVRTEQVGTIRLASTDPKDFPIIDPHFYDNPMDLERHVEGLEFMVDFFLNSPTYQKLGIRWSDRAKPIEQCSQFEFASHDYWKCYVPLMSSTALHPTSTCRMGPNSTVAVVDSKLRVFGATGLRIVDSSVIPFVPNGNTNLPSMMVGEMGARIILGTV